MSTPIPAILLPALLVASHTDYKSWSGGPEANIVDAVAAHILEPVRREYRSDPVVGWRRQPGGVDLAILGADGRARAVMEMKIDKVDESLWDLLKLAALTTHPHIEGAYLVYEARVTAFDGQGDCALLFQPVTDENTQLTRTLSTQWMLSAWPRAWETLLGGGYGNHPLTAPAYVQVTAWPPLPLADYPGREIRVVEVQAAGTELVSFEESGWPAGLVRPPATREDRPKLNEGAAIPSRVYDRWLEANVPGMDEDSFAHLLAVLKSRGWKPHELNDRVYPLRAAADSGSLHPQRPELGERSPPAADEWHRLVLADVHAIREAAEDAGRVPARGPGGWAPSSTDPGAIIRAMPFLGLEPGTELQGYEYGDMSGNGVVWAVPARTPPLTANVLAGWPTDGYTPVPCPPGARDPMSAVVGDGTPWAYMCASLAARELREFAARWHGCSWSVVSIIDAPPWERPLTGRHAGEVTRGREEDWEIIEALPEDWSPRIQFDAEGVLVVFFTVDPVGTNRILKNADRYSLGHYTPESRTTELVRGPGGMKF